MNEAELPDTLASASTPGVELVGSLGIVLAATSLLVVSVLPVVAHSKFGSASQASCAWNGAASHTTNVIDADTYPYSVVVDCRGTQSKARWKLDGIWYSDTDTDTTHPYYASAGTSGGYDIFSSSDHNAKVSGTWWGFKLWH